MNGSLDARAPTPRAPSTAVVRGQKILREAGEALIGAALSCSTLIRRLHELIAPEVAVAAVSR